MMMSKQEKRGVFNTLDGPGSGAGSGEDLYGPKAAKRMKKALRKQNRIQKPNERCSFILVIAGLALMAIGAIDPLEGSPVILCGIALAAVGMHLGRSRHRKLMSWAFGLGAIGVAAMFLLSARGGLGGSHGLSWWWGLIILPYPAGWIMGLVGGIRRLLELRASSAA